MKRIAAFVLLAYAAIFVAWTMPVILAAFYPEAFSDGLIWTIFSAGRYWVFIGILLVCEAGLLLIPLRITRRRPVTRRHLWLPVLVTGLLMGALAVGVICSVGEFIRQDKALDSLWPPVLCGLVVWFIWGVVFCRLTDDRDPQGAVLSQCRALIKGSVITLLIAVPTHIVARARDYCCAGFFTFIGLTFGLVVLLISFGPGVYFLYAARWRRLHPGQDAIPQTSCGD